MLVIMVVLATMTVLAVDAWSGQTFDHGVSQFDALLRMVRADAAMQGRRMRIGFDADNEIQVQWEPLPLQEPATFHPRSSETWNRYVPNGMLRVTDCRLTGASSSRAELLQQLGTLVNEDSLPALTFYPDGTGDSCLVELAPVDEEDPRRAILEVDGLSGAIHVHHLHVDQLDAWYDQVEQDQGEFSSFD